VNIEDAKQILGLSGYVLGTWNRLCRIESIKNEDGTHKYLITDQVKETAKRYLADKENHTSSSEPTKDAKRAKISRSVTFSPAVTTSDATDVIIRRNQLDDEIQAPIVSTVDVASEEIVTTDAAVVIATEETVATDAVSVIATTEEVTAAAPAIATAEIVVTEGASEIATENPVVAPGIATEEVTVATEAVFRPNHADEKRKIKSQIEDALHACEEYKVKLKKAHADYQRSKERFATAEHDMLSSNLRMLADQSEYAKRCSEVVILQQSLSDMQHRSNQSRRNSEIDPEMILY
jgi:hypothetical protein